MIPKKRYWLLALLWCLSTMLLAQQPQFKVMISDNKLHPGDTLDMEVAYSIGDRKLPPASFVLTMLGPGQKVWQMRWPMVEGKAEATLVLPDSLPAGAYNLLFAVQPRFLKLFGEVVFPDKVKMLTATVSSGVGIETLEIKPDAHRKFTLENVYIEGQVAMQFYHDNHREAAPPLIKLDAWLDSSFTPADYRVVQIVVNKKGSEQWEPARIVRDEIFKEGFDALHAGYAQRLAAKHMQGMSPLVVYDSLYMPAAFKAKAWHSWDCTADSVVNAAPTLFELLQQKMPGLQVQVWGDASAVGDAQKNKSVEGRQLASETMIKWKDQWYRLYIKGGYHSSDMLMFPPSAFASVKVFEPPFYTLPGTKISFGTIAVFERRWPLPQAFPYNSRFFVQGYTPAVYLLPWP